MTIKKSIRSEKSAIILAPVVLAISAGHEDSITAEKNTDNDIKAICNNCSKRFKSIRAITMHLKMTASRHVVNFIEHGNYNKNTGMREMKPPIPRFFAKSIYLFIPDARSSYENWWGSLNEGSWYVNRRFCSRNEAKNKRVYPSFYLIQVS